jgi:hypothetical protein
MIALPFCIYGFFLKFCYINLKFCMICNKFFPSHLDERELPWDGALLGVEVVSLRPFLGPH